MPPSSRKWPELTLLGLILAVSLALRLTDLDSFLAGDETKWICRSIGFHDALRRGDLRATYQSEHPGVVTMWLGTLSVSLDHAGEWVGLCAETQGSELTQVSSQSLSRLPGLIAQGRRSVALVTWLGIVALYPLLTQLFDRRTALLATALVALDPFFLALSRVLHLDGLLATFMGLSVVLLLIYQRSGRRRYLVASGVLAGLAIANKSPGGFLVPWTGLFLAAAAWPGEPAERWRRLWSAVRLGLLWGLVAAAVVIALWPALWVDPVATVRQVLTSASDYAAEPHGGSNYFWHAIRPDPGAPFYPVTWAFRTTPWVMLGLLLLPLGLPRSGPRRQSTGLGLFALAFGLFMTVGAKKFDRYGLPFYLPLDILAAVGLVGAMRWVAGRLGERMQGAVGLAVPVLLLVTQTALLLPTYPYYFSYYNPMLGGARIATDVVMVGWGEGLEQAAAYLNAKPDAERMHVNTGHLAQFAPYFVGHTSSTGDLDLAESDYYVFYINLIKRRRDPQTLDHFLGVQEPEHTVWVHGIPYAEIYANTLYQPAMDLLEERVSPQTDVVLLDVHAALTRHYSGPLPLVVVPGDLGEDDILRGLAEATAGRRTVWYLTFPETPGDARGLIHLHLAQQADIVRTITLEGMEITEYRLHPDAAFQPPTPSTPLTARLGDAIVLQGYDPPEAEVVPDEPLLLTLYWHAKGRTDIAYTVFTHLVGPDGAIVAQADNMPVSGARPTNEWVPGDTIADEYAFWLPPDAPAGEYTVLLGMYDWRTGERLPAVDASGQPWPENAVRISGIRVPPPDAPGSQP